MPAADVLVSTQWVADHLNDAKVKLLEVDVDTDAYGEGHPAGAVGWNWTSQLQDQLRRDIITKPDLEKLLGASGVANDDTVVLYGDNNNWFAAYAFWVLEMYGHRDLKLVDGGRKKWLDEKRPTTKDAPSPAATIYKASDANLGLRAMQSQVRQHLTQATRALVDVRSPAEYTGEILAPRPASPRRPSAAATSPAPPTFLGARPCRRTAPSSPPTICASSTPARASRPTRTSSPTAASASAHPTVGSPSSTCSTTPTSATTTAPGPSGAAWSTSPWRSPDPPAVIAESAAVNPSLRGAQRRLVIARSAAARSVIARSDATRQSRPASMGRSRD